MSLLLKVTGSREQFLDFLKLHFPVYWDQDSIAFSSKKPIHYCFKAEFNSFTDISTSGAFEERKVSSTKILRIIMLFHQEDHL